MPRRLLAVHNFLTAAALLYLVGRLLHGAPGSSSARALSAVLLALALAGLAAAIGTWRGARVAAWLTLALQCLQLPQLATGPLTYLVTLPFAVIVGCTASPGLHWHTAWRPGLEITRDGYQSAPWIGINLWALLAVGLATAMLRRRASNS